MKTKQIAQELKSILIYHLRSTQTYQHMAKDGQVSFHRRLYANPVNPQRCTTESVNPLDGTNKDVSGAKLQLTTTSVYPVDCACFCPLLKTQHYCLCIYVLVEAVTHLQLPTHPATLHPPLIHATRDITVVVKKLLKTSSVS